jgi:hypothetical protein
MFLHTTQVQPRPGYRLYLEFNNGVTGEVSLLDELWGEVFAPLRDEHLFLTAHQNHDLGTVVWANGADLAPEFLLQLLQAQISQAA